MNIDNHDHALSLSRALVLGWLPHFLTLNADPRRFNSEYDAWKADWVAFMDLIIDQHGEQGWDDLSNKFEAEYTQHDEWTADGWK